MRKMMIAALFTVLSLSVGCAVEPGPQPADDQTATDESATTPVAPPKHTADDISSDPARAEPTAADHAAAPGAPSDLEPVLESIPCDSDDQCPSNVCDEEVHYCREYPF